MFFWGVPFFLYLLSSKQREMGTAAAFGFAVWRRQGTLGRLSRTGGGRASIDGRYLLHSLGALWRPECPEGPVTQGDFAAVRKCVDHRSDLFDPNCQRTRARTD